MPLQVVTVSPTQVNHSEPNYGGLLLKASDYLEMSIWFINAATHNEDVYEAKFRLFVT